MSRLGGQLGCEPLVATLENARHRPEHFKLRGRRWFFLNSVHSITYAFRAA
jgi:hypothetical protein